MLNMLQDTVGTSSRMLHAGLVDLDGTFLIQLGIFLIFAIMLNFLLIQPLMKAQDARFSRMAGAREDAESANQRAADAFEGYETRLSRARKDAVQVRDALRTEGEGAAQALLSTTREETAAALGAGRATLTEEADRNRQSMQQEIDRLADAVAGRVLNEGSMA